MATLDEHLIAFCDYVEGITNLPVVKSKRAFNPQMTNPFITVGFESIEPVSKDISKWENLNNDEPNLYQVVRGAFRVTFVIEGFGHGIIDILRILKLSFTTEMFGYWADTHKFGTSGFGDLQDLSDILTNANYEERGQLTASFYVVSEHRFNADYFNKEKVSIVCKGSTIGFWATNQEVNNG